MVNSMQGLMQGAKVNGSLRLACLSAALAVCCSWSSSGLDVPVRTLELPPAKGNPKGHYCYIAIHPMDDAVLLGYCAMSGLGHSRVTRVPVAWLYVPAPVEKVKPASLFFDQAAKGPFERLETLLGFFND